MRAPDPHEVLRAHVGTGRERRNAPTSAPAATRMASVNGSRGSSRSQMTASAPKAVLARSSSPS